MSRLFQRHPNPARGELQELKKVLGRLKSTDAHTRLAVGAGVSLANTDFLRRFAGIESFRKIPLEAQQRFFAQLVDLEFGLRNQDVGMAIGVGLYRIWLADLFADRQRVADLLGEELTELSRAGFGHAGG